MRIAKIVRRSNMHVVPQFGVERGKLFSDDAFLDGTFRQRMESAPIYSTYDGNMYPSSFAILGTKMSPRLQTNPMAVTYSSLSGVDCSEFVSQMGITAGNRYRSFNGQLIDQNNQVIYCANASPRLHNSTNYWTNYRTSASGNYGSVSRTIATIIHETPTQFILYVAGEEQFDSCGLIVLAKSNYGIIPLFTGQFSIHRLGVTRPTETTPEHTLFLVMLNSRSGYKATPTGAPNPDGAVYGGDKGARVLLFGFRSVFVDWTSFYYVRRIHDMGPGPTNSTNNQSSFCSQRFLIDADSSLVTKDSDGYVTSFSFVAQNPTLVSETNLIYSSTVGRKVKLNDNLCLFTTQCQPDAVFSTTFKKIDLPADYLAAEWVQYSSQSNNTDHMSLVSGKAFYSEFGDSGYICVMLDRIGFELYMNRNVSGSNTHYAFRSAPDLQPLLIKIPVDELKEPIADVGPVQHRFPVEFGSKIREISMLLRKNNQQIVIPSGMYAAPTSSTKGVLGVNSVVLVNVVDGSYKIVTTNPEKIDVLNTGVRSVGVYDDKLLVIDAFGDFLVLDEGPQVSITFVDSSKLEGNVTANVLVSTPSTVELFAINGTFDNGRSSKIIQVDSSETVQITARVNLEVHVIACSPIEAST